MVSDSTKVWVLYIVLTVIGGVLIFIVKWFFNETLRILGDIKEDLKNLTHITTRQDIIIDNLKKDNEQHTERLNRHSNRIMDMEKHLIQIADKLR